VLGGNRGGKTVVGAAETVYRLLGEHPYKPKDYRLPRPPIKVWACSQDLPGSSDLPHKQLEELRKWVPKEALRGGEWEKAYAPGARVLTLANGSVVVFKSYDQGLLKFESDAVHFVWMDEEPDDKRIWTSCQMRLADYDGSWMITATPVLSLLGKGWLEELWEGRGKKDCGYDTHQLFSYSNPHLEERVLDELFGNLSEDERLVRSVGAFARLGGRVLSEFDPRLHLVDDYIPDRALRHYLIIDPGWKVGAHLFAAVDPKGCITLYAEHYAKEEPIPRRMGVLHALWQAFGKPEYDVIGDSAGFSKTRQGGSEKELPSDMDEYQAAAELLGATWFQPRRCLKGDPMAYRVKRYLQCRKLLVCRGLTWWQWECERWTRKREREGPAAMETAIPDAPITRNDHLMDCTRYLVNELPDPLPAPTDQAYSAVAEHWKQELEAASGTTREII